jgi:hypothetical protein
MDREMMWQEVGGSCRRGATSIVLFAKNNYIKQVKDDEMGKACSMYVEKRNAYGILVGKPEGRIPLRKQDSGWGGTEWIDLAQDTDQRRTLLNTVMHLPSA